VDEADVIVAAFELYRARNYAGVVAACTSAVESNPNENQLRLILAKALLQLRRDTEAQHQISEYMRRQPRCPEAYQMLGALALRRDELKSAEIFFKESLRLSPGNTDVEELLAIVTALIQPIAAGEKLPAAPVAVGCTFSNERGPRRSRRPRRFPAGTLADDSTD